MTRRCNEFAAQPRWEGSATHVPPHQGKRALGLRRQRTLTPLCSQHTAVVLCSLAGAAYGFRYVEQYREEMERKKRAWVARQIELERAERER